MRNFFTGNQLKYLGIFFMTMDHIGYFLGNELGDSYIYFRMVGRLTAIIFLFMVAEGFRHTSNRGKYILNMFIFSLIAFMGTYLVEKSFVREDGVTFSGNILSTFFVATVLLFFLEKIRTAQNGFTRLKATGVLLVVFALVTLPAYFFLSLEDPLTLNPILLQMLIVILSRTNMLLVEGDFIYVLFVVAFYYLIRYKAILVVLIWIFAFLQTKQEYMVQGSWFFENMNWPLFLTPVFIIFYNGKRSNSTLSSNAGSAEGVVRGEVGNAKKWAQKYFFYLYYPVHVWIIYVISVLVQK